MRKRSDRRDDSGFTIAEVAVTLFIFSIVSIAILSFLDSTTNITAKSSRHVQAERDGMVALRQVTQDVRAATNIRACASGTYASCITFDVERPNSPNPDCVTTYVYRVVGGQMKQSRADAAACANARTWTDRTLIATENSSPFSYTDRFGKPINVASTCSFDPNQPVCVPFARTVQVSLALKYDTRSPSLTLSSTAALRNNR